jgi:formamidopyrimidine-DNA glycosylase
MPELPDLTIYCEALQRMAAGHRLERIRFADPFLLRTAEPPITALQGKVLTDLRRLGKRLVLHFEDELYLLIHLMIAGRLRWREAGAPVPRRVGLAAFDFTNGTLVLTEAGSKRRAALHVVQSVENLEAFHAGGVEPLEVDLPAFREALTREKHTLKRALADPRVFSGIGNAYSDEILHRARLSPVMMTDQLTPQEVATLHEATRTVLGEWIERLRRETGDGFPETVTAFRDGMAVHGRYRQPCPTCGSPVQRIVHAENETNYCATCQTGGKLLADRALSRLLRSDWPKTLEELEQRRHGMSRNQGASPKGK